MSFVTDARLLSAVADRLGLAGSSDLPPRWQASIVPDANAAAYQEILGRLMARGFTKAQVDQWDRGAEYQLSIGLYFALVQGGSGDDVRMVEALDRRKELNTALVFISGAWVKPTGDQPGLVTTAGPSASGGLFNFPDPDDPLLGEVTRF